MVKRSKSVANAPSAKREKVSPVFGEIQDALMKAEHLPGNCRAMLVAMVPGSFATAREERSEQQVAVIQWMEDALKQEQAKIQAEVDAVTAKLSQVEATKAAKLTEVQQAEAVLAEKKEVLPLKKHALAEATIAMSATKKMLVEKQEEQKVCDADFIKMKSEQEGLAAAFVEHFKVPLDAGEALHYEALQPFISNLDLDESFMVSVPSSCCKTKEERGSFDDIVLQALEQALLERATQVKDSVSNRSPESLARESGIVKIEGELAVDRAAQEKAGGELALAQKDLELSAAAVKELEQAAANIAVEVKAALKQTDKVKFVQETFVQGPWASFRTSKDGLAATELSATAGA